MQTKLTLRLDDALIEKAKRYSKRTNRSVSQLVASYFALLEEPAGASLGEPSAGAPSPGAPSPGVRSAAQLPTPAPTTIPAIVAELHGCLRSSDLSEEDYRAYLEEKHS